MLASLETNRQMRQLNGLRDHNALVLFLCQLMISSLFAPRIFVKNGKRIGII